jgi:hypothetical protein
MAAPKGVMWNRYERGTQIHRRAPRVAPQCSNFVDGLMKEGGQAASIRSGALSAEAASSVPPSADNPTSHLAG